MAAFGDRVPDIDRRDERYANALALVGAGATARLIASGLAAVAALAAIAVTFRLLGTAQYGVLAFALSVVALLPDLGRLGIAAGAVRELSAATSAVERDALRDTARGAFTATMAIGVIGAVVVFVLVMLRVDQLATDARVVLGAGLAVVVICTQIAVGTSTIARGLGRVVSVEAPHTVQSVGRLVAVAILASLAIDSLSAVAVAYAIVAVLAAIVAVVLAYRMLGPGAALFRPAPSSARRLIRRSLPFAVTGLAGFVIARFDVVVLGLVRPSAQVGAYDPVLRAVERLLILVPLLFGAQGFPAATRMLSEGNLDGAKHLYHQLTKIGFVLSAPAVLVLAAFPEPVLRMLYGQGFPLQPTLVWVLLIGFVVNLVFGLNGLFLGATGRGKVIAITGGISLAVMVVSAAILVPAFGGLGAAAATAIAYVVMNLTTAWALHRTTSIHPFSPDLVRTVITFVLPLGAVLAVRHLWSPETAWLAAAWSFGAWGAWVGLLVVLGLLRRSDWQPLLTSLRPRRGIEGGRS